MPEELWLVEIMEFALQVEDVYVQQDILAQFAKLVRVKKNFKILELKKIKSCFILLVGQLHCRWH
jgi:hypothetical protein